MFSPGMVGGKREGESLWSSPAFCPKKKKLIGLIIFLLFLARLELSCCSAALKSRDQAGNRKFLVWCVPLP